MIITIVMAQKEGWRMVKSETRRDAETLVRNPSPRLFGKKFWDSKKLKTNHAKTRLRDLSKMLRRFRDPVKIFRDPRFLRYHSPPLKGWVWEGGFLKTFKPLGFANVLWALLLSARTLLNLFCFISARAAGIVSSVSDKLAGGKIH